MTDAGDRRDPSELLPLSPQELQVLLLLDEGPLHAYGIARASEADPGRVRLEIGSLYRMLNRMLTAGLIEEAPADEDRTGAAAMRKDYRITSFGHRVVEAEARRLKGVVETARDRRILPEEGG